MAQPEKITIRGITYDSGNIAARELGVSPALIGYYKRQGRLDEVGLLDRVHDGKSRPVTVHGVSYPSFSAAARAYGVTTPTISRAVERGTLDHVGSRSILD